mmetsp:Transcript_4871/g.7331  ORF Transcript_4871/g.7331 Transcript_4871/m.7331 type:complete len:287 (-) Transcript_4871:379-1239(-)
MTSRSRSHLSCMSSLAPPPFRMIVSSLVTVIVLQVPRCSSVTLSSGMPTSSLTTWAPVSTAMSWRVALRLSPNPGAFTAHTLMPPRSLLTTRVASASDSTSSAMIMSDFWDRTTASSTGTMLFMELIFFSTRSIKGFSISTTCVLLLVIKYGEMYPLSNFMPSTTSSSLCIVLPSCTVITPSLPTLSIASEMRSPNSRSLFADMVATCATSSLLLISLLISPKISTTLRVAFSIPLRRSIGFIPAATALVPSRNIARQSTVAVVVPSPAMSLVLLATWRTNWAPIF